MKVDSKGRGYIMNMDHNRLVARTISEWIGGVPKAGRYYDDNNDSFIDIFEGKNKPFDGVSTFSTIGLSEYSIGLTDGNKDIRVEFIGAAGNDFEYFPNIVSTCAFMVINDGYSCSPGTVYPNVLEYYYDGTDMKHIYFTTPSAWDGLPEEVQDKDSETVWLMMIPISDKELEFLKENGSDALESKFEEKDIDMFNLARESIF